MLKSFSRLLISRHNSIQNRQWFTKVVSIEKSKYFNPQIEYLKSSLESGPTDWAAIKSYILTQKGDMNPKNFNAVLLKYMINHGHYESALNFADYITSREDLTIGSRNGLLGLYTVIGKNKNLSEDQKQFILESHKYLYEKYKVLDSETCEKLLHALCVIDEWKLALKVLDDIFMSSTPSHSAFSTLIATLLRNNKKKEADLLIAKSVSSRRPLQENAYEAWIDYILRKYKSKTVVVKHLDDICWHISKNCDSLDMATAERLKQTYSGLGWNAQYTKIRKDSGQCLCCKDTLQCLKLSDEEFTSLQKIIKEKLIVGSDLFLKTSPEELKRFLNFIEQTAPYDIVLDALNIAYGAGNMNNFQRVGVLNSVVDHFRSQGKKMLLLGRKHMLKWPRKQLEVLMSKTACFFTEDLSQDDPYFITAAIISGPHTDFVSKDLLRGHRFLLKDENLHEIFRRWQWQHQWMVWSRYKTSNIQEPLNFTPCAQKKNESWHLPYSREDATLNQQVNDGVPDLSTWLCLTPKLDR